MTPIDTAPLFGPLHAELLALLRSLDPEGWQRPTVAGAWRVRDVAAHLLDGDLRKIAVYRDGHFLPVATPIESPADVARLVNGLNASGVGYAERLSPRLLTDLLEVTGGWIATLVAGLPRHGRSVFPVSWAGEDESENWMDTGREYTERWHHQMQIRDATGRPLLLEDRWLGPLLDISVRVLPAAYASCAAADGATVRLVVDDKAPYTWTLTRSRDLWTLASGGEAEPSAVVALSADSAWRLFYNALSSDDLRQRIAVSGDAALAAPLLRARSIVI